MLRKIGRLFSKNKLDVDHPIMDLLSLRSNIEVSHSLASLSDAMSDFLAIPQSAFQKVAHQLTDVDFLKAISAISPYFSFQPSRFQEILRHVRAAKGPDFYYWTIAAASDCLGMLLALSHDKSLAKSDLFQMAIEALASMWDCSLGTTNIFLFKELLEFFLETDNFVWDATSIKCVSNYIIDNRNLDDSASQQICELLSVATQQSECDVSSLIDVIRMSFVENREIIRVEDVSLIVESLIPFVEKLNLAAIEVVAMSSQRSVSGATQDCFLLLARVITLRICDMEPCVVVDERRSNPVVLASGDQNVDFLEVDHDSFAGRFRSCEVPHSVISESCQIASFLSIILKALKHSNSTCIEQMIKAMIGLDSFWRGSQQKYDEIYAILRIMTDFVEQISLGSFIDFLCDPLIFDPGYTIFDGSLPDAIVSLRRMVVSIFQVKEDASMAQLIVRNRNNPLLVCEILDLFVGKKCEKFFLDEDCLSSVISVLWGLLKLYSRDRSEGCLAGLHDVLYFLFALTEEKNESLYGTLFCSKSFVNGFVGMVFVDVLRPMVLERVREFLVQNKTVSIDLLCFYFCNLIIQCKDMSDHRCEELVCSIGDMLAGAVTHNMKLVPAFKSTLNAMLVYASAKPSIRITQSSVKFLNLMMQNASDFHLRTTHMKQLVSVIKSVGMSDSVFFSLMNLCASATSIGGKTLFLIRQPAAIPIIFAACGESDKLRELTVYFTDLCRFSRTNCIQCHRSRLDAIFLDFIREFRWNSSKTVSFQGFQFKLDFEDRDIEELLLPFLGLVIHVSSNNVIAQKFMNLILGTHQPQTSLCVGNFLSGQIASMKNRITPVFKLGQEDPCCHLSNAKSKMFNSTFSFAFWVKLDNPISFESHSSTKILSIKEMIPKGSELKIFLNRDALYFSFDKTDLSTQCITGIVSNKWTFFAFITKRFSQAQSAVGLFTDGHLVSCQDLDGISFNPEAKLEIRVGGDGKGSFVGLMGPFFLTSKIFSDEELEVMEQQGPTYLESQDQFICKTLPDGTLACYDSVVCESVRVFCNKHSLDYVLKEYDHYITLIDLFKKLDAAPDDLIGMGIGMMKHILKPSNEYAEIIRFYLMQYSYRYLSYSLYLALFSLTEVSQSESLFDNLIVNIELWSMSTGVCFGRVLHHWSHTALNVCHQMFERRGYFSRLLKMFDHMFIKGNLSKQYSEAEVAKFHSSFLVLLEESGRIRVDSRDSEFLLHLCYATSDKKLKIELLRLVECLSECIIKESSDFSYHFHTFVDDDDPEIVLAAIRTLHQLSLSHLQKTMTAVILQMRSSPCKSQVFEYLINDITEYPGVIELLCGIALQMEKDDRKKLLDVCEKVDLSHSNFLHDPLWFLWPILLFTQREPGSGNGLCMLLAKCLCGTQQTTELEKTFGRIVETALLFATLTDLDASQFIFDLTLAINAVAGGRVGYLIHHYIIGIICHFAPNHFSPQIMKMFKTAANSGVNDFTMFRQPIQINDILTLDEVLSQSFNGYSLGVTVSIDESQNLKEQQMLQLCTQMADRLNSDCIERDEFLFDYVQILLHCGVNQSPKTRDDVLKENSKFEGLWDSLNKELLGRMELLPLKIREVIKIAKSVVFSDPIVIQKQSQQYLRAVDDLSPFASAVGEKSVSEYMRHRLQIDEGTNFTRKRSLEIGNHFVPSKFKLLFNESEFDQLKAVMVRPPITDQSILLLSTTVQVHRFDEVSSYEMNVLKDQILLHRELEITRIIHRDDIEMVLSRGENEIELFCSAGSLFIDLSPMSVSEFRRKVSACYPVVLDMQVDKLFSKSMTKFDYLLVLNLISGKSFHIKTRCPTLPTQIATDPLNVAVVDDNFELFYFPELSGESFKDMYRRQKELEDSDIDAYARSTFPSVYRPFPKPPDFVALPDFFTFQIAADSEATGFIDEHLLFVKTAELVCFVEVSAEYPIVAHVPINLSGQCYSSCAGVVIVSDNFLQSVQVQTKSASEVIEMDVDIRLCTLDGRTFGFVGNDCSVIVVSIDEMAHAQRKVVSSHRIESLAINEAHKIIVCQTSECRLVVHSLVSGELTAVVDLDGCEFDHLILGRSWGSIILAVDDFIQIYTINGTFVRSVTCESEIKNCYTFIYRGIDYLVFVDSGNRIGIIDVMGSRKIRYVPSKIMQLSTLCFSVDNMGILGLTSEGMFVFVPFTLN